MEDKESRYVSVLCSGKICGKQPSKWPIALVAFLEAYDMMPDRLDPIVEIIKHYHDRPKIAVIFCRVLALSGTDISEHAKMIFDIALAAEDHKLADYISEYALLRIADIDKKYFKSKLIETITHVDFEVKELELGKPGVTRIHSPKLKNKGHVIDLYMQCDGNGYVVDDIRSNLGVARPCETKYDVVKIALPESNVDLSGFVATDAIDWGFGTLYTTHEIIDATVIHRFLYKKDDRLFVSRPILLGRNMEVCTSICSSYGMLICALESKDASMLMFIPELFISQILSV